jgi:hypothetical protein
MVDALDSKSGVSNGVRVRVSSPVKFKVQMRQLSCTFFITNLLKQTIIVKVYLLKLSKPSAFYL